MGPVLGKDGDEDVVTCNRIVARELVPESRNTLSFVLQGNAKEVIDPGAVKNFFEQDFSDLYLGLPWLSLFRCHGGWSWHQSFNVYELNLTLIGVNRWRNPVQMIRMLTGTPLMIL